MAARRRVVVTHWVHPEVVAYLSQFSDPVVAPKDIGVWPASQVLELARGAEGLIACMADRVDNAFLVAVPACAWLPPL